MHNKYKIVLKIKKNRYLSNCFLGSIDLFLELHALLLSNHFGALNISKNIIRVKYWGLNYDLE